MSVGKRLFDLLNAKYVRSYLIYVLFLTHGYITALLAGDRTLVRKDIFQRLRTMLILTSARWTSLHTSSRTPGSAMASRTSLPFISYPYPALTFVSYSQANSSHFWLNEGFTTYIERVLLEKLHSPAERGFSYLIGWKGLQDDLKLHTQTPKYQRLVIEFEKGEDPDDAYSRVPYDKGANFLLYLGGSSFLHFSVSLVSEGHGF